MLFMKKTDWNNYYDKPFKVTSITRKITEYFLVKAIQKYSSPALNMRIVELGGANSCFFESIKKKIGFELYCIIDNNRVGLEKFKKRFSDKNVRVDEKDILLIENDIDKFDLVFSVGLIEHFDYADTARAIKAHDYLLKESGICIITFPTPTYLYRIVRKLAELLHIWNFPDERPLKFEEVENTINEFGTIMHKSIIWPIFLTQGIIVFRKKDESIYL